MGRRAERPGIAWNCILAAAVTVAIDASVESSTKQCSFGIQELQVDRGDGNKLD